MGGLLTSLSSSSFFFFFFPFSLYLIMVFERIILCSFYVLLQ
jgi:hypothetical protein